MTTYPEATVHGRFQPPLHVHHWNYVKKGFEMADQVTILITNPTLDESFEPTASWRSAPQNNPFTLDERVFMFDSFFRAVGIERQRYRFKPFNIKTAEAFKELDPSVPNLVNQYSDWSRKKVELFEGQGLSVVRLANVEIGDASGTRIRELINECPENPEELAKNLINGNFMPEAVPGLLEILDRRKQAGRPLTFDDFSPDLSRLVED